MNFLKTPKKGVSIVMTTFLFYIIAPVIEAVRLYIDLAGGKFPVNSDSIFLGLVRFIFALIIFAPFVAGFVFWVVWKYQPQQSLLGYNRQRPFWSFIWTFVFGFFFFTSFAYGIVQIREGNLAATAENFIICYFCLLFRASIIFRKGGNLWERSYC